MSEQEILDKPARIAEFDAVETGLSELRNELAGVQFDVTTTAGDKAARAARSRCVSIRTSADAAYEGWNKPMLAKQREMRAILSKIKDAVKEVEEPIDAQIKAEEARRAAIKAAKEEADRARQQAIQDRITALSQFPMRALGQDAAGVAAILATVAELPITTEFYEHRTGEAMQLHAEVAAKLEQMHAAALAQEQEAARIAAERAALAKEQAALKAAQEAEAARQEAARAEQRRQEEAAEAAARQREEEAAAALRAQQEEIDRQRRDFEAKQEAARRAEQEKADAAAREKQEQEEAERRAAEEAERSENRAARLAPEHTGGTWSIGRFGSVVTDTAIPGATSSGHNDAEFYGGHLIAESIWRPADARLIAAAPRMLGLLKLIVEQVNNPRNADHTLSAFAAGARMAESKALIAEVSEPFEEPTTV